MAWNSSIDINQLILSSYEVAWDYCLENNMAMPDQLTPAIIKSLYHSHSNDITFYSMSAMASLRNSTARRYSRTSWVYSYSGNWYSGRAPD